MEGAKVNNRMNRQAKMNVVREVAGIAVVVTLIISIISQINLWRKKILGRPIRLRKRSH